MSNEIPSKKYKLIASKESNVENAMLKRKVCLEN